MTQLTIAARYSSFMVEHDVGGMAYRLTEYWYIEPREHGNTSPIVIKHEYADSTADIPRGKKEFMDFVLAALQRKETKEL